MNKEQALEYAAKILEADALMHYGATVGGYEDCIRTLQHVAGNPEWREVLENSNRPEDS